MKVTSEDLYNPNHKLFGKKLTVFVDGKLTEKVLSIDTEENYAEVVVLDSKGRGIVENGDVLTELVYGQITYNVEDSNERA